MFLRSVRLNHWACHPSLEIELGPGLNVVVGPNGIGKSTLCGAIIAALTIKYSSKDRDVRALEPWGTEGCGPSATLLLRRADGDWRLSKRYLHDPSALLERLEGDRFALRHKGRAAEEEIARWLDADGAAGRLLLELWSPQADPTRLFDGAARNGRLGPASLLGGGLADRVGAPEPSGPFALAKHSVAEQVARSFTPVNRQVRVGSELHQAQAAFRDAEENWAQLHRRQEELARLVEEYLLLEAEHRADCDARDRLASQAERREHDRAAYRSRLGLLQSAEEDLRRHTDNYQRAERDHRRLLDAAAELAEADSRLADLDARLAEARSASEAAEHRLRHAMDRQAKVGPRLDELAAALDRLHRLDEATRQHADRAEDERDASRRERLTGAARDDARARRDAARDALDHAERDRAAAHRRALAAAAADAERRAADTRLRLRLAERAQLLAERSRAERALIQVRARVAERAALDPSLDGGPVPSEDEARSLRASVAELEARSAALDADRIFLRFEAARPLSARLVADRDAPDAPIPLDAGASIDAGAVGRLLLEIDGVGRIEVSRGSAAPEERRRRLDADRIALADRLAALGAGSLAAIETRLDRARRRTALDAELAALLGDETPDSLQHRLASVDDALRAFDDLPAPGGPESPTPPIDRLRAEADAAERALAIARDRLDSAGGPDADAPALDPEEASRRVELARSALDEAEDALVRAHETHEAASRCLVEARARLADAEQVLADEIAGEPDAPSSLPLTIASIRQDLVVYNADPPGETALAVRIVRKAIEDDLAAARRLRDDASAALADLVRAAAAASSDRNAALRRLDEARAEADDDRPADDRERHLDQLRADRERAGALVDLLRERLGPDPSADDLEFDRRRAEVAERCRLGEQRLAVQLRELELLGADGLDTKLALAAEELDDRRARLETLRRDASAWRLLDRVLAEVEGDFARNIARQIEGLSSRWVARLTGRNVRSVVLDPESLSPVSAVTDAERLDRALAHFSRGTREQVALACRLQLGALLAQDARQMILLDDPLAHTDRGRHDEALDVLLDVARSLQVLIFTCHPDRYERLWESGDARRLAIAPAPTSTP